VTEPHYAGAKQQRLSSKLVSEGCQLQLQQHQQQLKQQKLQQKQQQHHREQQQQQH
jgi:hypothetical protein